MALLPHSRRSLLQAVCTQSLAPRGDPRTDPAKARRPWVKRAFLSATRASKAEIAVVRKTLERLGGFEAAAFDHLARAAEVAASPEPPTPATIGRFGDIDSELLVAFAEELDEHRQAMAARALQTFQSLAARPQAPGRAAGPQRAAGSPGSLGAWLAAASASEGEIEEVVGPLRSFTCTPSRDLAAAAFEGMITQVQATASAAAIALKQALTATPLGYLHLERVDFTPAGIERGELVGAIPLAPGEKVHVSRREWATSSEDFVKTVSDYQESFSEEGVTEKAELIQATTSQKAQLMSFNTGVTASGGYGPVMVTATAGLSLLDSREQTEAFSRAQTMETTRKAASRARRDHKVSLRVVSASGDERTTAQRIENPFPDKATRVDYYRLVRKWLVEVYRYGIRLTYDITIPEPGSDLLDRHRRVRRLEALLLEGFDAEGDFTLTPDQITRDNYAARAAAHGAYVPAPPPQYKHVEGVLQKFWKTADDAARQEFHVLEIDVDEDYAVEDVPAVKSNKTTWKDHDGDFAFRWQGAQAMKGKSGRLALIVATRYLGTMYVQLRAKARLRDDLLRDWQLKAWAAIRDAAVQQFDERRQGYKAELARLRETLSGEDTLSLRRVEREEVMKGVLRWLFGPDFRFVAGGAPSDLYTAQGAAAAASYQKVLAQGELIRFLHQAIEWENMLFFLYPYFWSSLDRWDLKQDLQHPDPLHRAFLKSGCARVVLTIRPGFERDFLSWMEQGEKPMETHEHMTMVQEMEAYAKTSFPGMAPANAGDVTETEPGYRVGAWYEYTPTGALDIAFGETLPPA